MLQGRVRHATTHVAQGPDGRGGGSARLPPAAGQCRRSRRQAFRPGPGRRRLGPDEFCDPKTNTPGEPIINRWAQHDDIRQAGNIPYAPFANNAAFFEKYHQRMLVINGVDSQTNSHTVGIVHNWSGRTAEGYPSLTALLAAHYAPALPIPYLSFGGFSATAGVTRFTRINYAPLLKAIAHPTRRLYDPSRRIINDEDWALVESARAETAQRLAAAPHLLPAEKNHLAFHEASFATEGLKVYADAIPPEDQLEAPQDTPGNFTRSLGSTLRRQAQLTVLAFKTGVAVSADLWLGGFDTHTNNDPEQEWLTANLTDTVDYLWEYAEVHGLADRLVVVMGSDFGRTNFYNAADGKDHWPYGSYIVMEKNQPWTGRVVGETDELHFPYRMDPSTLLPRDDAGGTLIYPKHVHKALRRYLGIENTPGALLFPFNNTEDFAFFT